MIMKKDEGGQDIREIIAEIQNGNTAAFGRIIEGYQKLIGHIVFRMVSNPADREDIAQDIFIKIYQKLDQFRFEAKFSTWISKIAYNTCINYLNKKETLLSQNHLTVERDWDSSMSNPNTPLIEVEKIELSEKINQEILQLPENYRMAITLFHLQEFNYQEISDIMNIPVGTVKSYLFRGRQYLKEKLQREYYIQVLE